MSQENKTEESVDTVKKERVSEEDLKALSTLKDRVERAVLVAQKTSADARCANLEYESAVQKIFIRYGLSAEDQVNEDTGEIKRKGKLNEQA